MRAEQGSVATELGGAARLGKIEAALLRVFIDNPCATFDTMELAAAAYPGAAIEKKHTVVALRVAKRLAERYGDIGRLPFRGEYGNGIVYFTSDNARSLSLAKLRAFFKGSRSASECVTMLDDPTSEPHALAQPDGYWGLMATRNGLLCLGRDEEARVVQEQILEIEKQAKRERDQESA